MLAVVLAKSGEAAKSGPIGLAIILLLCIVCYFLFKSMSKHLKKVREEFPEEKAAPSPSVQHNSAAPAEPAGDASGPPAAEPPAE
jgi:hypothetical protein